MSSPAPVQPLRINKGTPSTSPLKMAAPSSAPRPLAEIGSSEQRRNSPSFASQAKVSLMAFESSPYNSSSPLTDSTNKSAPHRFWQSRQDSPGRDIENMNFAWSTGSMSNKRSSIENLKRASRVKNSSMFAKEQQLAYDPTSPPPVMSVIPHDVRSLPGQGAKAVEVHCDEVHPLEASVVDEMEGYNPKPVSISPTKSAMANNPRYQDKSPAEPRKHEDRVTRPVGFQTHHVRNNKSVTFDAAPPQVNEYEQATPDPSVGTVSREGSYDTISGSEDQDDSYLRGDSCDRDTSFENPEDDGMTIPVIEPESWRSMTPEKAHPTRGDVIPDPFGGSEDIDHDRLVPHGLGSHDGDQTPSRSGSTASSESRRPLPPVPSAMVDPSSPSSSNSTMTAIDASKGAQSSPFSVGVTKDEIKSSPRMSLAERLKLMGWQDQQDSQAATAQEEQRERRMRRAVPREPLSDTASPALPEVSQSSEKTAEPTQPAGFFNLASYRMPKINRESILAKVRGFGGSTEADDDSDAVDSSPLRDSAAFTLNPDEPMQSIEHDAIPEEDEYEVSGFDADDISELYNAEDTVDQGREVSPLSACSSKGEGSVYADTAAPTYSEQEALPEPAGSVTPKLKPSTVDELFAAHKPEDMPADQSMMSLPDFGFESALENHDFGFDLKSYLTPSPPSTPVKDRTPSPSRERRGPSFASQLSELPAPRMPGYAEGISEPQTPESVIHHSFADSQSPPDSPAVEEPVATVKASGGGKLKVRPSLTPADAEAMATARRQVSGHMPPPPVPAIPARHKEHRYSGADFKLEKPMISDHREVGAATAEVPPNIADSQSGAGCSLERKLTQKQKLVLKQLDLPIGSLSDELSMSLEADFDRVVENQKVQFDLALAELSLKYANMAGLGISNGRVPPIGGATLTSRTDASSAVDEAKKIVANSYYSVQRGYLMRQNTKVVHASSNDDTALPTVEPPVSRATKSAGNSPVKKPRESISKAWQAEPWNGKARRQSIKHASRPTAPTKMDGPVPPLPGQESAVNAEADTSTPSIEEDSDEKGRLFVKVMGVKDLDLPLARGERTYFCLTLDNGLHCVTTSWLELGKNCPIGQEFELVVLQELEFQLTLQAKLEPPKLPPPSLYPQTPTSRTASPTKNKPSTFSRVFGSPKKRKENEKKQEDEQRAADARQAQLDMKQRAMMGQPQQTSYDLLQGLVARDGSFGRSYVSLKEYEGKCYGRPVTVDVACFNEWATEQVFGSSVKSKSSSTNGSTGLQSRRRAPYKIGKLEVQLLFVPKPKAKPAAKDGEKVTEVELPKSLNAAVRDLRDFEERNAREFEGFLSQQGGDCPYWRRRFFKLKAHRLTAFHESTRQPRANINLTKAAKIVGDRATLTQSDSTDTVINASSSPQKKSKGRRKSAFAEEEEGYMMVEEGFRLRFQNGEVIDFYADSKEEKRKWMDALSEVVGKDAKEGSWCDLVLQKEKGLAASPQKKQQTSNASLQKPLPKLQPNGPPITTMSTQPELRREYPMAPPPPTPSASARQPDVIRPAVDRVESDQSKAAPMPRKPNFRPDYQAELSSRPMSQPQSSSPARPSSQPGFQTTARPDLTPSKPSTTSAKDFANYTSGGMTTQQMIDLQNSRPAATGTRSGFTSPTKRRDNEVKKKEVGKTATGLRPKSMLF